MITPAVQSNPSPLSRSGVLVRAVLAWAATGAGLGVAGAVGNASGWDGAAQQALSAAVFLTAVVVAVVLLRRVWDRKPLATLGLAPGGLARFGFGLGLTLGCAAVVVAVGAGLGMVEFGAVDVPVLLGFLAVNAVVALALEAVPEELAFRGYILTTLNRRLPTWAAVVIEVGLFAAIMVAVSPAQSLVETALGQGEFRLALAPEGMNPVDYVILMLSFGFTLTIARLTTGSVWTGVGIHLAFLTVNRLTVASGDRETGWEVTATGDAALLVPLYLAAVVTVLFWIGSSRIGWRAIRPQ